MDNNPANMAKYIPTLYFHFKASLFIFPGKYDLQ